MHILHYILGRNVMTLTWLYHAVYDRRGKDVNKNRAEWEHEREGMKRETERLKHELLRLVSAHGTAPK